MMNNKQTQLAIIFNGVELSKEQIDVLENGINEVISSLLISQPGLRNHVVIRDVDKFAPKLFEKPFTQGILIDFRKELLSKANDNYHV